MGGDLKKAPPKTPRSRNEERKRCFWGGGKKVGGIRFEGFGVNKGISKEVRQKADKQTMRKSAKVQEAEAVLIKS